MKSRIRQPHPATGETLRRRSRLLSGVSYAVVLGIAGALGFAFPEITLASENDPSPTITVLVFNYSRASPATLTAAERGAGQILGKAGLRAVWLECPMGRAATVRTRGPCRQQGKATDIRLRVLAAPMQNNFQDTVLGFAIHPIFASVYYEYVSRRAESDDAEFETPLILGSAIAHELGHLLLGSNGHSGTGIMQPRWEPKQVHQILTGGMLFTTEQSKIMREAARTRLDLETRNLKEPTIVTPDQQAGTEPDSTK